MEDDSIKTEEQQNPDGPQHEANAKPFPLPMQNLDFSGALKFLRLGYMIQREGWNGKGMFLFVRPEFFCALDAFTKIISVPTNVKAKIINIIEGEASDELGLALYKFTAYISMFAADRSIVNGWLASQTDMLSNDWQVVE